MARPLISVITPTWLRSYQLTRCLDSVAAQTWSSWEHIVVSDGPDAEFMATAKRYQGSRDASRVVFAQLDEHRPEVRWGVEARLRGLELAQGDIVAWLDDDNGYRPHHLELLCQRLLEQGASWAYSQCLFQHFGNPQGGYVIGAEPPQLGQLDTSAMMSHRALYDKVTWRDEGQQTIDWDLAERWMGAGYSWAFLPAITVDYYLHLPGGPRMAKWHMIVSGEVDDAEKLPEVAQAAADALADHGLLTSQFSSDYHNGPLPAPQPKPKRSSSKSTVKPDDA